jgi:hypothetical protein
MGEATLEATLKPYKIKAEAREATLFSINCR